MPEAKSVFRVGEDIEVYKVVVVLNILALSLLVLEFALHLLEKYLSTHHEKYQIMLKKVYRELMILGLLSFIVKMLTEVGGISQYSGTVLALQVADLIIFILAIMLIVQACIILLLLRRRNRRVDLAELVSTQDLVGMMNVPENATLTSRGKPLNSFVMKDHVAQHRILRHLFLRRFGLPHLFPFSKYLRLAQANNTVNSIEIEPSMWVLVLGMSWAFCGAYQLLDHTDTRIHYELVLTLMAFAWLLVLANILVTIYFRFSVRRLLNIGGCSTAEAILMDNLAKIAKEEAIAWDNEAADDALELMNQIQVQHEDMKLERESKKRRILRKDAGVELAATCCKNFVRVICSKDRQTAPNGVMPDSPAIHLPWFSWNAWNVIVMLLPILNAFFIALLVQGAVYNFGNMSEDIGIFPVILIPLPLIINALLLHKCISRDFVLISVIVRMDVSVLGEVISHFSEVIELRSEFAAVLLQCMNESKRSIADLEKALQAQDLRGTGFIDVNKLRVVLASFGFRLTQFKFNNVIKLLFTLRGTSVEYAQVIHLLSLMQQEYCVEDGFNVQNLGGVRRTTTSSTGLDVKRTNYQTPFASYRHFSLLNQSCRGQEQTPNNDFVLADSPSVPQYPDGCSVDEGTSQRRGYNGVVLSSRVLHSMYNLQGASFLVEDLRPDSHKSMQ